MEVLDGLAYVTSDEMRAMDQEAIDGFSLDVLSLMENAGAAVAVLAWRVLGTGLAGKRVSCLVGKGNNGGDGLVAARHLRNWGAIVEVMLASRSDLGDIVARQLRTVESMGLPVHEGWSAPEGTVLLIDALLGYNSRGNPRQPVAGLISRANESCIPILAVDVPSGLDPTTGNPNVPCITARATLALGLPKSGFLTPHSRPYVGELYVGDVSIPASLYRSHSYPAPHFEGNSVVRVKLPP